MKKQYIYSILFLFFLANSIAQQTPAPKQTQDYSIEGATAHLGNGKVIENSLIMFSEGKIKFVGSANMKIARMGKVIDAKGKHVYPGFIVANTSLGLGEIDAVRATLDYNEVGAMNPHVRSLIAYNSESRVVESMRPNGVFIGQITPRGGTISGTSSIVQFDAWNWEDAALKIDDGIHLNWPKTFTFGKWWLGEDAGAKPNKKYAANIEEITSFFLDSKRYLKSNKNPKNLPFEALEGLFNSVKKLYIHANGVREITDAIYFSKKVGIPNIVIVKGNDAYKIADLLVKNNIPVILERAHRVPNSSDADYDLPFRTAKLLVEKGVVVAIGMDGSMERMSARNLPEFCD